MSDESRTTELLPEYVADLMDGIRPQVMAKFIREHEDLSAVVFAGFRPTIQTMRMPVVRQRLMRELDRDRSLVDAIRVVWTEGNSALWSKVSLMSAKELEESLGALVKSFGSSAIRVALAMDERENVQSLVGKLGTTSALALSPEPEKKSPRVRKTAAVENRLASENEELKRKVRGLQHDVKDLERRLQDSRAKTEIGHSELKAARNQVMELVKQLVRLEKQADRLRRAKESVDYELSAARRELKHAEKELNELKLDKLSESAVVRPPSDVRADWTRVISNFIKDGSYGIAREFCERLKEMEPENVQAHIALEEIYARLNERDRQIDECGWIAMYMSRNSHPVRAAAYACRSLAIDPTQHRLQLQFRRVLESVKLSDDAAVSGIRRLLSRLKLSNLLAHRQAVKVIKQMGKTYAVAYEGPRERLHPDKVFGISDGNRSFQLSISRIIEAINLNEQSLVEFLQRALPNLRRARPNLYRLVIESIENQDRSCITTIKDKTSPIVVDGSNVAWHEAEDKPSLQTLLDVRAELRSEGFFPVYIYIDASLPYQIDQPAALRKLVSSGAVIEVESRTDADEMIVARAKSLGCPIVSNDRMTDWDPTDEISKVKVAIDARGVMVYGR